MISSRIRTLPFSTCKKRSVNNTDSIKTPIADPSLVMNVEIDLKLEDFTDTVMVTLQNGERRQGGWIDGFQRRSLTTD